MNQYVLFVRLILILLLAAFIQRWISKRRLVFDVPEGWAGLLYRHGLYVRRNNAGRHTIWGAGWSVKMIDLRKASLRVADQEVTTADKAGLKFSLLVTYQVTDPDRALHETQNWLGDLYYAAQLALPAVANGITAEAVLNRRSDIGAQLLGRVQPEAAKMGVQLHAIEIIGTGLALDRGRISAV